MARHATKSRVVRAGISSALFFTLALMPWQSVFARDQHVSLEHQALSNLPSPGEPIALKVILRGTRDAERPLRAFVVRDGRLLDLYSQSARYNERDEVEYSFAVHAPLAEINYQFVVYNPDGSITPSKRFGNRRRCVPSIEPTNARIEPSQGTSETRDELLLQEMVRRSNGLERDDQNYQRAIALLEELRALVEE